MERLRSSNDTFALLLFIEPFANELLEESLISLVATRCQGPNPP
jgi:hypothetical protein